MGFSRQEYWSGLPFPSPGDLSKPEIRSTSSESPALAGEFFTTEPPGKSSFASWHFYWSEMKTQHAPLAQSEQVALGMMPIWGLPCSKCTHSLHLPLSAVCPTYTWSGRHFFKRDSFIFLNWSIVDLQCSVSGVEQTDSVVHMCVHAYSFSLEVFTKILNIDSSLCYTIGPCLSIYSSLYLLIRNS